MEYLWASEAYRWTDLVNSDVYDYLGSGGREDRLEVDEWLAPFLERCGYRPKRLPGASGRAELRRLRNHLAKIVFAIIGGTSPDERAIAAINRHLRRATTHPRLDRSRGRFALSDVSVETGLRAVVGLVARSFAETLAKGELDRIKVCANPDCHWVMVDESRNRSRRWCEVAACGNLIKVRQFRERKARARRTHRHATTR